MDKSIADNKPVEVFPKLFHVTTQKELDIVKNAQIEILPYGPFYFEESIRRYVGVDRSYVVKENEAELMAKFDDFNKNVDTYDYVICKYTYYQYYYDKRKDFFIKYLLPKKTVPGHWCITQNLGFYGTDEKKPAYGYNQGNATFVYVSEDGTVIDGLMKDSFGIFSYILCSNVEDGDYDYASTIDSIYEKTTYFSDDGSIYYDPNFGGTSYNTPGKLFYSWNLDSFPSRKYDPEEIGLKWRFYPYNSSLGANYEFICSNIDIGVYNKETKTIGYYIKDITDTGAINSIIDEVGMPNPEADYLKGHYVAGYSAMMNTIYAAFIMPNSYTYRQIDKYYTLEYTFTPLNCNELIWNRYDARVYFPNDTNGKIEDYPINLELFVLAGNEWKRLFCTNEQVTTAQYNFRLPYGLVYPIISKSTYILRKFERYRYNNSSRNLYDYTSVALTFDNYKDVSELLWIPVNEKEPDYEPGVDLSPNKYKHMEYIQNGVSYRVKKWINDGITILKSGCVVSYYNGTSLIGSREYDEGTDVLRPGFSPTKSGYTFVGWSKTKNGTRVTSLTASGESMTLYAVFAINSLNVASGHLENGPTWIIDSIDSAYVTGDLIHVNESYGESSEKTTYFTVTKGIYSTAKITFGGASADNVLTFRMDGVDRVADTAYTISAGRHSIYSHVFPNDHYERKLIGVKSLILSNPTKWQ